MIKKCRKCENGKVDYSMSEINLIETDEEKPQEAEIEGICDKCSALYVVNFKEFKTEITEYDELMEEKNSETIFLILDKPEGPENETIKNI